MRGGSRKGASSIDGVHDEGRGAGIERMQAEEELVRAVDVRSGDGFDAPTLGDEFHADATSRRRSPGG
jgi:hypothetical protein